MTSVSDITLHDIKTKNLAMFFPATTGNQTLYNIEKIKFLKDNRVLLVLSHKDTIIKMYLPETFNVDLQKKDR